MQRLKSLLIWFWRIASSSSVHLSLGFLALGGFVGGVLFWGAFNTALEVMNTEKFCTSCHEMRTNVFEELQRTPHFSNRSGVRASLGLWPPVIAAYQALHSVAFITAVTFVAKIGDIRRFETPRQLMGYLGLVASERSTGDTVRRGSITKAGNARARRVLIEGAWIYRYPPRVSQPLQIRQEGVAKAVPGLPEAPLNRGCCRYRPEIARHQVVPLRPRPQRF
jgi:hypothetical protein